MFVRFAERMDGGLLNKTFFRILKLNTYRLKGAYALRDSPRRLQVDVEL